MQLIEISSDDSYREFRRFVNSLRCPLCNSQLDGNVHTKEAKLYCVSNNEEYSGIWEPHSEDPRFESIKYFYSEFEYVITIAKVSGSFYTNISRYNVGASPRYKPSTRKQLFELTGPQLLFFRKRMEEKDFLNKLKLYNVFS